MECLRTGWLEAFPLKSPAISSIVELMQNVVFAQCGLPDKLVARDEDPFNSQGMRARCAGWKTKLDLKANIRGQTETTETHSDLKMLLQCLVTDSNQDWSQCLVAAKLALNCG